MYPPRHRISTFHRLGACAIALAALTACGSKDAPPVVSQVAAKVGSEEISVHQINQVLSRTPTGNASPEEIHAMGRVVLEKLIDQQLAVDQAMEANLNRSPEVVTQIESSRRDILAGAYLRQITSTLPRPTPDETHAYYVEHPALFSERRVFQVQELVLAPNAGVTAELRSFAAAGKPVDEVAAWLKAKSIPFTGGNATRSAEQIPLDALSTMHTMKDGQTAVLESAAAITLLHLVSSQSIPVAEAAALPRIGQFLMNQRVNALVASKLQALRASTKIAYLGEFAKPDTEGALTATPAAATTATAADPARAALDKGVAGLK